MPLSQHDDSASGRERAVPSISIDALIRDARAGSTAAMGQLMESYRKYLLLVANQNLDSALRPKAGASDLVQDTFCDAQRDFGQFRGESEQEFFAWLTGIMNHRMANHGRRYRTRMRDVDLEAPLDADERLGNLAADDLTPGTVAQKRDEESHLLAAMARLPEPLRQILALRTWERHSFVEIGAALEISADAARQKWSSAVARLKKELRKMYDH